MHNLHEQMQRFTLIALSIIIVIIAAIVSSRLNSTANNSTIAYSLSMPLINDARGETLGVKPSRLSMVGVNLSGGQYGKQGGAVGIYGTDYIYPSTAELDYYATRDMNVIRLPFRLERVQPVQNGPLNTSELARIDTVVSYAGGKGLKVILDPHNFGNAWGANIGSIDSPDSTFADFWRRMAQHYAGASNVLFGLMNEPHEQSGQQWASSAEAAILAIRSTGATQEILVPNTFWDSGMEWNASGNSAALLATIKDPLNYFAFEVHQYFDGDATGTHFTPITDADIGIKRLNGVTNWAQQTGNKLFLGEFGVPSDTQSLMAMCTLLRYMQQNSGVWEGGTYWAGGPWWGSSYSMSIEPTGAAGAYTDRPQMFVLRTCVADTHD
jgi:endoglucanase